MYIYHVENVRAGQGGRLYLEIPQNGPFWPETQLNPPDQLPITFFWYESKLFKSVHNVQQLQGNKKELNNHDAMCSWGSEEQKNIKKSSRKWDFFQILTTGGPIYLYIYIAREEVTFWILAFITKGFVQQMLHSSDKAKI